MQEGMQQFDPEWAWAPFEPAGKRPLDARQLAHLFRRAGFAAADAELNWAKKKTAAELARDLTYWNQEHKDFERDADGLARTMLAGGNPQQLSAAWVYRMLHTPNQLLEKTTLFWHGHFATSAEKVQDAGLMWQQSQLLRKQAIGSFPDLVQGIAQDPAMLIYLDSATNRKSHPNENFARELMELFCLGEGHYSEADVQELAKCFTGWEIKNRRFRKNRYQQDRGEKTVLGQSGKMDGEEAIRTVLDHGQAANFISGKIVQYFVCDEPKLTGAALEPLAKRFRESGLQIAPLIEQILASNFFYSSSAIARKIRSPVELNLSVLRALEATTNTVKLAQGMMQIGQGLFYPPNVKGWDGGRTWINSATLLGRTNLLDQILHDETTRFAGGSLEDFFESKDLTQDDAILDWLSDRLFAIPIDAPTKRRLVETSQRFQGNREQRLKQLLLAGFALPVFQLG